MLILDQLPFADAVANDPSALDELQAGSGEVDTSESAMSRVAGQSSSPVKQTSESMLGCMDFRTHQLLESWLMENRHVSRESCANAD